MSDLHLWAIVVGFFLPLVVAAIQQPKWSDSARGIVTFLACLVAGGGTAYFQGDLTGRRFISAALFVLVTAVTLYKVLWKPSGVAPAIESATTVGPTATLLLILALLAAVVLLL